jgi:hypothetical protein
MLTEIMENAIKLPDKKERVEFVPGTIRGKKVGVDWDVLNQSKIVDRKRFDRKSNNLVI